LRVPYRKQDGEVGYRCPAEPPSAYVRKGGKVEATAEHAACCNGLIAAIGLGQRHRDGAVEPPLATSGRTSRSYLRSSARRDSYKAADVVAYLSRASRDEAAVQGPRAID